MHASLLPGTDRASDQVCLRRSTTLTCCNTDHNADTSNSQQPSGHWVLSCYTAGLPHVVNGCQGANCIGNLVTAVRKGVGTGSAHLQIHSAATAQQSVPGVQSHACNSWLLVMPCAKALVQAVHTCGHAWPQRHSSHVRSAYEDMRVRVSLVLPRAN